MKDEVLEELFGEPEGAYPKESIVLKCEVEEGDFHKIGAEGVVKGAVVVPEEMKKQFPRVKFGYLVEFGEGMPTFVLDYKIKLKEVS